MNTHPLYVEPVMLARRIHFRTCASRLPSSKPRLPWNLTRRRWASSVSPGPIQSSSDISLLAGLTTELDRIAPRIDIRADQIEVLDGPKEFYDTLKSRVRRAKRRIYLSTLYIGKSEHELISTIREALLRNGPDLRVSILTDALRGTRESPEASCASLLAALVAEFPERVEVRMYHTPNLTGLRKRFVPKRINEGWGLQHIKLYGFDDEVILSGANLSNDYFTNRQDRYHMFTSIRVSDYFAKIHHAVCSVSFLLQPSSNPSSYSLSWPSSNPAPSPLENPHAYISATTALLQPLTDPVQVPSRSKTATFLYPLISHPPTLNTELPALRTLLSTPLHHYTFTAGYFNPHPLVTASLLACSSPPASTPGTILTASPFANGFYNSAGISGLLPAAYTHLSLRFLQAAKGANLQLREWRRGTVGTEGGWTYHAKGLWVTLASTVPANTAREGNQATPDDRSEEGNPSAPTATVIGSSNYTTRSYGLDLEVGALVITTDPQLKEKWKREEENLLSRSREVKEAELGGEERRAGWRVRVAMWIVRVVGGSL